MYKEKQLTEFSGLLHDLTILKTKDITIKNAEVDIKRRNTLILANKLFELNVPEVSDKSPKYISNGEMIKMMMKKLRWG